MPDLTCAELARRYGVQRSTVSQALARAAELHDRDPQMWPAPPWPVNPGEPQLRYRSEEMDAWWPNRPRVGRPRQQNPGGPREKPRFVSSDGGEGAPR